MPAVLDHGALEMPSQRPHLLSESGTETGCAAYREYGHVQDFSGVFTVVFGVDLVCAEIFDSAVERAWSGQLTGVLIQAVVSSLRLTCLLTHEVLDEQPLAAADQCLG